VRFRCARGVTWLGNVVRRHHGFTISRRAGGWLGVTNDWRLGPGRPRFAGGLRFAALEGRLRNCGMRRGPGFTSSRSCLRGRRGGGISVPVHGQIRRVGRQDSWRWSGMNLRMANRGVPLGLDRRLCWLSILIGARLGGLACRLSRILVVTADHDERVGRIRLCGRMDRLRLAIQGSASCRARTGALFWSANAGRRGRGGLPVRRRVLNGGRRMRRDGGWVSRGRRHTRRTRRRARRRIQVRAKNGQRPATRLDVFSSAVRRRPVHRIVQSDLGHGPVGRSGHAVHGNTPIDDCIVMSNDRGLNRSLAEDRRHLLMRHGINPGMEITKVRDWNESVASCPNAKVETKPD
jgi:hypothetical protein